MRRTKAAAAVTRDTLLDAALKVFSSKGYTATSLDDIANAAGVTRGAIYWHFGGKAELYHTLVGERFAGAMAVFEQIFAQGGRPLETLSRLMRRSLEYLEEDADYRAVLELNMFKTEVTAELAEGLQEKRQANQQLLASLEKLVREGLASGEIRQGVKPETAALAALGLIGGITSLWLQDPTTFSAKASARSIVETFLQGITAN